MREAGVDDFNCGSIAIIGRRTANLTFDLGKVEFVRIVLTIVSAGILVKR